MKSLIARVFVFALWVTAGCNGSTVVTDGATDSGTDAIESSDVTHITDVIGDTGSFVCPADPSTLEGQPCSQPGQTCGTCSDPCQFCNLERCDGTRWTHVEAFPGPCDGGAVDAQMTDASGGVTCGSTTCGANEVCVHTVRTGGACRMPEDGGCGPGEHMAGDCCVAYSEEFRCAATPTACTGALSCGCGSTLCGDAPGACPCQGATGSQLECACFFP
jgi:hypothetical protein